MNSHCLKLILALSSALAVQAAIAGDVLRVWHHGGRADNERERMVAMIDKWNKANPNHLAKLEIQPEGSYNEQVQAAALSNNLPDLLDLDGANFANYAWSGYLAPLNGLVSTAVMADMLPSLLRQGTYAPDGKVYMLGQADSGLSLWGRKSLLLAAKIRIPKGVDDAWTAAEFDDALAKLQKQPGIKYALDVKLNYGQGEWFTYGFSPWVQSLGGDLIDRKTWQAEGVINSAGAVKALTLLQSYVKKGYIAPSSEGDDSFYGKKTAALSYVGHWMWAAHSKAFASDLVLLPMPRFGKQAVTGSGGWAWSINSKSKHKPIAGKLLDFLLSTDQVAEFSNAMGGVPGVKSAANKVTNFKAGGPLALYIEQLNKISVARPAHPAYPTITAAFSKAVAEVVAGGDVKAALDKAAKKIDTDIADNKGYAPFGTVAKSK
jgi:multiple sugar transport system substrate-binding protein